jgi:CheY-like chemotaxis protein
MKILIVDDNLSIRKVLSALFEAQGHRVVGALEDGSRLFDCIKENSPDLVCLDYHLPGKNGLELLAAVHASSPDIAVVLITGSNDPDLVGQAANAGAVGFLHKPFSQPQILGEIKNIEEGRQIIAQAEGKKPVLDLREPQPTKGSVVIVDDMSSIRMLLKGILESIGFTVLQTVSNGAEAVKAARSHQPSIICLDVDMPVMSGLEALPLIREASPQSKVVMVTGNANRSFIDAAIASGAKGYIVKPIRPSHVEAFMKKLVA